MVYVLSASENPAVGPINWSNYYPSNHPILRLNRTLHGDVAGRDEAGADAARFDALKYVCDERHFFPVVQHHFGKDPDTTVEDTYRREVQSVPRI